MSRIRACPVPSPVGPLEGLLDTPDLPPTRAVVVCHPHPLHGGTMHSHVTYQAARAFRELGFGVLRFNFRGTGRSPGTHDHGVGETQDVAAALDRLGQEFPGAALWVCGYSFGAWVGLRAGDADPRVRALVGIGLPLGLPAYSFAYLAQGHRPVGLIQGTWDEFGSPDALRAHIAGLGRPVRLWEIADADHSMAGQHEALRDALAQAVAWADPEGSLSA